MFICIEISYDYYQVGRLNALVYLKINYTWKSILVIYLKVILITLCHLDIIIFNLNT